MVKLGAWSGLELMITPPQLPDTGLLYAYCYAWSHEAFSYHSLLIRQVFIKKNSTAHKYDQILLLFECVPPKVPMLKTSSPNLNVSGIDN